MTDPSPINLKLLINLVSNNYIWMDHSITMMNKTVDYSNKYNMLPWSQSKKKYSKGEIEMVI